MKFAKKENQESFVVPQLQKIVVDQLLAILHVAQLRYLAFAILASVGARVLSDLIFSALVTLSAAVAALGFVLLYLQVKQPDASFHLFLLFAKADK